MVLRRSIIVLLLFFSYTGCEQAYYSERFYNHSHERLMRVDLVYESGRSSHFINIPSDGQIIKHHMRGPLGNTAVASIERENGKILNQTIDLKEFSRSKYGYGELMIIVDENLRIRISHREAK